MAIQVLPPKYSAGGEAGQAFGAGFNANFVDALENKEMSQALAGLSPDSSIEEKSLAIQGLNISPQKKQQALQGMQALALLQEKQEAQKFKQEEARQKQEIEEREGPVVEKYLRGEQLTPEDFQSLSPTTRRSLIQAQAQPAAFEKESEKLQAQSAHKYYDKVLEDGKTARKQLVEVEVARDLNKKGVTGLTARNKAADILGEWIRDPSATEFRARSKQFMEGIKELIGGRITEFEFKYFQNMFPNLEQSEASNEALLGMVQLREEAKIQESKITNQIVKQNGGKVPPDLQARVDEKMDTYMDKAVDRWKQNSFKAMLKEDPPGKDEVAVIDDQGQYMFLPKSQAKAWVDSGRMVIGQ